MHDFHLGCLGEDGSPGGVLHGPTAVGKVVCLLLSGS